MADTSLPTIDDDLSSSPGFTPKGKASELVEGFYNLNVIRQLGLMMGLAASVAIGFAIVLWAQGGSSESYRPLYGSIQNIDVTKVVEVLESNAIEYKVDHNTGALLVIDNQIHTARLKLADAGFPGQKAMGFELLDADQPLGTSQFMETARFRRSLEGELSRTISSISVVRRARVHLAIPKSTVFIRNQRKPSASILVDLFPGSILKPQQVRAIANLVAASIPELALEDVAVVDQKGNLLSNFEEQTELAEAEKQLKYIKRIEDNLNDRINRILLPVVGEGKFKAEVAASVDFTEVEQTDEVFNPDLPAIRSEQTLDEKKVGGDFNGGIPGALSNQPPGAANAPEVVGNGEEGESTPPSNSRSQATRNYELDRTISYTKHQVGKLKRLTVAVVVDDVIAPDGDGNPVRTPWTENELERLAILVKNAVGFDVARGDSVNVINSPFVAGFAEGEVFEEPPFYQQPWIQPYIRALLAVLAFVALILFVVRPVLNNLSTGAQQMREEEEARALAAAGGEFDPETGEPIGLLEDASEESLMLPSPTESYDQQLSAVKALVAEDPGRVSQVIKQWINGA